MPSIFTKIINRTITGYIVAETTECIAFLDIHPIAQGHTLVVPKKEVSYIFDLTDNSLAKLHIFAKKVALGIQKVTPCVRIGTAVVGLEVPHAHIHLIPLQHAYDIDFRKPTLSLSSKDLSNIAEKISKSIASETLND